MNIKIKYIKILNQYLQIPFYQIKKKNINSNNNLKYDINKITKIVKHKWNINSTYQTPQSEDSSLFNKPIKVWYGNNELPINNKNQNSINVGIDSIFINHEFKTQAWYENVDYNLTEFCLNNDHIISSPTEKMKSYSIVNDKI